MHAEAQVRGPSSGKRGRVSAAQAVRETGGASQGPGHTTSSVSVCGVRIRP